MRRRAGSPRSAAAEAKRTLKALRRPAGQFDAARYFRGADDLEFYNIGMTQVRALAADIVRGPGEDWSLDDVLDFAEVLLPDPVLEVKMLGVDAVARFRRQFEPRQLARWKGWLANDYSTNWATTDSICGNLIGPLVGRHPELADGFRTWARHRNLWVRRAAAVSLVAAARRGELLDVAYDVAKALHTDPANLIHKAVGWLLREAGKTDMARLERYLRQHGSAMPRTTVRYALEKFPPRKRQTLLAATRGEE